MIAVVAGVVRREGRVLLCQRPEGKRFGLLWEFPGGKVEAGETPEAALERELREELDVETRTGRVLDALRLDARGGGDLLLLFYESEICLLYTSFGGEADAPAASAIEDDGMLRVYLKSLGDPASLGMTLAGSYTVEGDRGFRFDRDTAIVLSLIHI